MCNCTPTLYWNSSTFSSTTINTDVTFNTLPAISMPEGTVMPKFTMPCNGSTVKITLLGAVPNNSNRTLKLKIGSTTNDIWQLNGTMTLPTFVTEITLTRNVYNSIMWKAVTHFNSTSSLSTSGAAYTEDTTTDLPLSFLINQSVASSIIIAQINISK